MKFNFTELDLEILQEHAEGKSFEVVKINRLYELGEDMGLYDVETTIGRVGFYSNDSYAEFISWKPAYELLEEITDNIEDWDEDTNPWNSLFEIVLGSMKEIK